MAIEKLGRLAGWWYGAFPLIVVGAAWALRGAQRGWHGLHGAVHGDAGQLVPLMEGFRTCIIGLALVGIGAAWIWHLPVLVPLSLAIGAGETMETSLILFALRFETVLRLFESYLLIPL
jgi:hypothetical protein